MLLHHPVRGRRVVETVVVEFAPSDLVAFLTTLLIVSPLYPSPPFPLPLLCYEKVASDVSNRHRAG